MIFPSRFVLFKQRLPTPLLPWTAQVEAAKATGATPPPKPKDPFAIRGRKTNLGGLFNGKIAPLIPYALRGILWYQGEGNAGAQEAHYYKDQLTCLVRDWRGRWGSNLPFAWVQLPNYGLRSRDDWPRVREQMLQALELPRTGMAVTIDIGDPAAIHPANKQEVGRRLALWALGTVYGRRELEFSGPLPAGHTIRDAEIVLSFRHTTGGLQARGGELVGFQLAGEDRTWLPARARIAGEQVVVSHPQVPRPVAVRYAWENNPICNLYNGAGLPASPFRTDAW